MAWKQLFVDQPHGRPAFLWRLLLAVLISSVLLGAFTYSVSWLNRSVISPNGSMPALVEAELSAVVAIGVVLSVLLVARWIDRWRPRDVGLRMGTLFSLDLGVGALLGAATQLLPAAFLLAIGNASILDTWIKAKPAPGFVLQFLPCLVVALGEAVALSIWLRGYLMKNFAEALHGIVRSSIASRLPGFTRSPSLVMLLAALACGPVLEVWVRDLVGGIPDFGSGMLIGTRAFVLTLSVVLTRSLALSIGLEFGSFLASANILGARTGPFVGENTTVLSVYYDHLGALTLHPYVSWDEIVWIGGQVVTLLLLLVWIRRTHRGAWFDPSYLEVESVGQHHSPEWILEQFGEEDETTPQR